MLDLFQIRRCEENLEPSPRASRLHLWRDEQMPAALPAGGVRRRIPSAKPSRVEQFLRTDGASLLNPSNRHATAPAPPCNSRRPHKCIERADANPGGSALPEIWPARSTAGRRRRDAVGGARKRGPWFLIGGRWQEQARLVVIGIGGRGPIHGSAVARTGGAHCNLKRTPAMLEHLAILVRWHGSSWRDGEWIGFEIVRKDSVSKDGECGRASSGAR